MPPYVFKTCDEGNWDNLGEQIAPKRPYRGSPLVGLPFDPYRGHPWKDHPFNPNQNEPLVIGHVLMFLVRVQKNAL